MGCLTNAREREDACRVLRALLEARGEWFCTELRGGGGAADGARCALRRGEWELSVAHGALHLSYWSEAGARTWRVEGWGRAGERLRLEASRRAGAERATLELTPRASVGEGVRAVREARLAACARLAAFAARTCGGAKVERVSLSAGARRSEPGRYARIILRRGRESVAVTGAVVALGAHDVDALLTSALLWWSNPRTHKARPQKLWLVVSADLADAAAQRVALLRGGLRRDIEIFQADEARETLTPVAAPALEELLRAAPAFHAPARRALSETAARIIALAPEAVDVVHARHGETLRYHGLAFARVRRLLGREHVWFGAGGAVKRRVLSQENWRELAKLVEDLIEHRRADAPDRRHALYASAPEAWLESILRRDIRQLDPGLIVSPLHTQLRVARDGAARSARPLDLLALRRDGRLVVVELKVSEDAALALQGADYWRRVAAHHRAGHIARARLFGDAVMSAEPPLVYAVAPLLRFHRSFAALARALTPELEMYRFDISEDWRAGVRVARRSRAN